MDPDAAPLTARVRDAADSAEAAWRSAVVAALVGAAAFLMGISLESTLVHLVHGNPRELGWLSDGILSASVAFITYLLLNLKASRTRLLSLEREQLVIEEQLQLAAQIQRGLLPEVPPAASGLRWAARMVPAGQIGGDFYDLVRRDGAVLAILADVSGKGIPAALILSSLKTLFRTIARDSTDPASIAERISAELYEGHAGQPYVTAVVARLDAGPRLAYVNAGHPAGYLLRDGRARACIESCGLPLGLFPEVEYRSVELGLLPGDVGVLVTDGITEAFEGGPVTLAETLARMLDSPSRALSPAEICARVLREAADRSNADGAPERQDDRTLLVFAVESSR